MSAIHFTGNRYSGFGGTTPVSFTQPGHYQVSAEKAEQLVADFPHEFSVVHDGTATVATKETEQGAEPTATETSEKAPENDEKTEQVSEPSQEPQETRKPAKKSN